MMKKTGDNILTLHMINIQSSDQAIKTIYTRSDLDLKNQLGGQFSQQTVCRPGN